MEGAIHFPYAPTQSGFSKSRKKKKKTGELCRRVRKRERKKEKMLVRECALTGFRGPPASQRPEDISWNIPLVDPLTRTVTANPSPLLPILTFLGQPSGGAHTPQQKRLMSLTSNPRYETDVTALCPPHLRWLLNRVCPLGLWRDR